MQNTTLVTWVPLMKCNIEKDIKRRQVCNL